MLRLYIPKPLATDVALDANQEEVARVAENWTTYYDTDRDHYERSLPARLWNVVADTQYAHMVWRLCLRAALR